MKNKIFIIILTFFLTGFPGLKAQWTDITPKGVSEKILSVSFPCADTGFAVGWGSSRGIFMKTVNGGNSWNVTPWVGYYFFNVQAKNSKEIVVSGYTSVGGMGIIMRTTNGGANWDKVEFDEIVNPFSFGILNFLQKNDSILFVVGYTGAIIYSENSGKNWQAAETKAQYEIFKFIAFPSHEIGYAACGKNSDFIDRIYRSTDWGDHWILWKDFRDSGTYINNMYFLTNEIGFIAGSNEGKEAILKTTDGGTNWFTIQQGDYLNEMLSITFRDEYNYFAVNDAGKIIQSTDAGETWSNYSEPTTDLFVTSQCVFRDSVLIVYVGGSGIIKKHEKITGIEEITYANSTILYPNPVSDIANVRLNVQSTEKIKIIVTDIFGRVVFETQEVSNQPIEINFSMLQPGTYFYQISNSEKFKKIGKFVKM